MAREFLRSGGVAEYIDRAARQHRAAFRGSATLGNQAAIDELAEIWNECRSADWDGHGALPVEQATLRMAYNLIDNLPIGFPRPSIGAEPDGQLTLEWWRTPHRILSISVDPAGFLHYAGLFGMNRRYGTLTYFSSAPDELLQLVREL